MLQQPKRLLGNHASLPRLALVREECVQYVHASLWSHSKEEGAGRGRGMVLVTSADGNESVFGDCLCVLKEDYAKKFVNGLFMKLGGKTLQTFEKCCKKTELMMTN